MESRNILKRIWKEWGGELLLTALFLPLFWVLMDSGYLNDAGWIAEKAWLVLGVWAVAALVLALGG